MNSIKTAAIAVLALAASGLPAAAQSSLTNGPDGLQPNTPASRIQTSDEGKMPSRQMYRRTVRAPDASHRPLTVRRTVAAAEAPVAVGAPMPGMGPGMIVTGPLGFASSVVALPFRALNGIFPATGDIGTNPLVLIGAPLHAIGDIAQVPFRVIGAPFGGTPIAAY